jgi:quinoprotein glucose dehydrogenase
LTGRFKHCFDNNPFKIRKFLTYSFFAKGTLMKIILFCAIFFLSACQHIGIAPDKRRVNSNVSSDPVNWSSYAGEAGASKFSPARIINKTNAKNMKVAWVWDSVDNAVLKNNPVPTSVYQSTPLMVNDKLFISTSLNTVLALDPKTGAQVWSFNPNLLARGANPPNSGFVHRGVSYWSNKDDERILLATGDFYLTELDAKTGLPVSSFGENGTVDLLKDLRREARRELIGVSSPPAICADVAIVGSSITDFVDKNNTPVGDVRGYDIKTGKLLWTFHTIPQKGEFGIDSWKNDSWKTAGQANVWTYMSVDPELRSVYLPVSTPSDDMYGGERPGNGLFGESIVSLDCKTGKRNWHYQIVHHGLWDYDLPAAPVLMNINKNGQVVKALAQVTKQAFTFVLDRRTGRPIWPIKETLVPVSTVPGEKSSRTQPIPTKPAPFDLQGLTDQDIISFSPELYNETKSLLSGYNYGPLYTPPSLDKPVITMPGSYGGASWSGAAYNPETQMLYVPSVSMPFAIGIDTKLGSDFKYALSLKTTKTMRRPDGLPIIKPPYGRITAIDMVTGEHRWMRPSGVGPKKHPALAGISLPEGDLGWDRRTHILTTPEILFAAQAGAFRVIGINKLADGTLNGTHIDATNEDPLLKAIDAQTGEVIGQVEMPGNATGAPMTYVINGKQFIVVPFGGANLPAGLVAISVDE